MLPRRVDRRAQLALLAHVASRPDRDIDLGQASLLLCEPEYPGLDIGHYVGVLDRLGEAAVPALGDPTADPAARLERLVRWLFDDVGFRGNSHDYYDPRNSYLNEVLERRLGNPITLAIVAIEVARRARLEAEGVSFPGHFLVRCAGTFGPVFFDPFEGQRLDRDGIRTLYARTSGETKDPDAKLLEPAAKRHILVRVLNNLRGIYAAKSDEARLREVLERIDVLAPSSEIRTELEQLGTGRPAGTGRRELN